jgi:hypothetical protein
MVPAAVDQVEEILEAYVTKCSKRAGEQRDNADWVPRCAGKQAPEVS